METFKAGTGLMGATESGQCVTAENVGELPPGSVVRIGDGSRLIHLHDDIWLWCGDCAWCYDRVESLAWRLDDKSVLCHMPATAAGRAGRVYLSEVFRIVEGATRGDLKKVKAYAGMLADKLEEDGEENSARWLRQIIEGKARARIVARSAPTDPHAGGLNIVPNAGKQV